MNLFYNYNGKLMADGENFISPDSRAFRYGDGLFETMVMRDGVLMLADLHFERLFDGLAALKFDVPKLFTATRLIDEIINLCKKNKLADARLRLAVFRSDGGLYDPVNLHPNYIIQCWPLPGNTKQLNENGLGIDVYPEAQKAMDGFANIKTANYLPYVMAALYARENKLNDCLVLNAAGRIADSTIANLFFIKEDVLFTPALSEGCVAGVMRKFLLKNAAELGVEIVEQPVSVQHLLNAGEVFLTNATYGIRWVKQFREKEYLNTQTQNLYKKLMNCISSQQ
jgi:branched-chain amino acid aminotransferase